MTSRLIVVLVLLSTTFCAGCRDEDRIEPPTLHLGAQECDFCRMMISDGRFAAACIVRDSDDRLSPRAFDDIGCLLCYEADADHPPIVQRYVTDYESGHWLTTEQAVFLQSEQLHTPMASGIAACASSKVAEHLLAQFPGRQCSYPDLTSRNEYVPTKP